MISLKLTLDMHSLVKPIAIVLYFCIVLYSLLGSKDVQCHHWLYIITTIVKEKNI